jgi:hypothetical protein
MKILRFAPLVAALTLASGCQTAQETNAAIDEGVHAPKRSIDMAKGVETDSNIGQINAALSLIKADSEGKAPATLEEAKAAAKVPASMWIDGETGKPLEYDPANGTVRRAP